MLEPLGRFDKAANVALDNKNGFPSFMLAHLANKPASYVIDLEDQLSAIELVDWIALTGNDCIVCHRRAHDALFHHSKVGRPTKRALSP